MRGDADIGARLEQRVEAADEARAHRLVVGERDRRRLDVDALAETDIRPQVGERAHVLERAAQVGLQHHAQVLVPRLAQLPVQAQRVVRRRRVLHVDPDEVPVRRGVPDDVLEVLAAEVVREVEPERGELHADVRVEPLVLDLGEDVPIRLRDRPRLVLARDLLAEDVDRRHLLVGVEPLDDHDGVGEGRPRDVARREDAHDRLRHRGKQTDDGSVEQRHGPRDSMRLDG